MIASFEDFEVEHKMSEDRFWELVARADWPNRDYEEVKWEYMSLLSEAEAQDFGNIVGWLSHHIDQVIGPDRNPAGGGDDSYWDLCNHIVGMGREQYYAHLNDYTLIEKLGKEDGFMECFTYCIPSEYDYEEFGQGEQRFIDWAKKAQAEITDFLNLDTTGTLASHIVHKLIDTKMALQFLVDGDIEAFMKHEYVVIMYMKSLKTYLIDNRMELPRKFTEDRSNCSGQITPHFISGIYIDYRKWLKAKEVLENA